MFQSVSQTIFTHNMKKLLLALILFLPLLAMGQTGTLPSGSVITTAPTSYWNPTTHRWTPKVGSYWYEILTIQDTAGIVPSFYRIFHGNNEWYGTQNFHNTLTVSNASGSIAYFSVDPTQTIVNNILNLQNGFEMFSGVGKYRTGTSEVFNSAYTSGNDITVSHGDEGSFSNPPWLNIAEGSSGSLRLFGNNITRTSDSSPVLWRSDLTGATRSLIGVDSTSTQNTYSHLMSGFTPGTIAGNNGWTLAGSAVGVNSGTQSTTITAAYTTGTDYALCPERFNQGKMRFLWHQASEKPMVTWGGLSTYFSISQTGGTATFGTVTGGVLTSLGTFTIPFTTDTYVQVNYTGQTAGSILSVKIWPINGTYPSSNVFTYTFTGSETAVTGDQVTLRTLDGTASQINSLDIKDEYTILATKATFTGDWFKVSRGTHVYQSVIAQGAYFDFVVKSATYANLKVYADSRAAYQPQLEVSIDGGAYNLVTWSSTGDIVVPIAAGMDATKDHRLTVYVKGVHELDDLWNSQEGFLFNDIVTDGHVTPYNNYTGLTAWYGDSIVAGIVAYGYAASPPNSQPSQSAGHLSFPQIAGRRLNQRVYMKGFGAAGLINPGHGNVPIAVTNLASFASGYPKYNNEQPNTIFLNYGTNDGSASSASYIAAYNTYIAAVQAAYPRAKIFLIDQFNGVRTSDNSTVALNSTVTFIPTQQFVGSMTFIADGLHPDINGHDVAGNALYSLIVPQIQPSQWANVNGKGISYVGGSAMVYANNNVIRNSDGGSDFTTPLITGSPVSTQLTSGSISPGASGTSFDVNKINTNSHNVRSLALLGVIDSHTVGSETSHWEMYSQPGTGTLTKEFTFGGTGNFTAVGTLSGTALLLGTGTSATVKDFNIVSGSKANVTLPSRSTLTSGTNGMLHYLNDGTNNYGIASLVDNPNNAVGFSIRYSSTQPAFVVQANSTELLRFDSGSRLGLGVTLPTAYIHLKAGVAAAKGAPIKFSTGGIVLTTPEAGALEATNAALFYTDTVSTVKTRREVILDTKTQTLTNKTLTSPQLNTPLLNTTSVVGQYWVATNTAGAGTWTTPTVINRSHTIFTPATGGTVTLVTGQINIINPAGTIATLTLTLPSSPANNDIVSLTFTQAVTAITYSGGTVVGSPTTASLGGQWYLTYDSGTTTWY